MITRTGCLAITLAVFLTLASAPANSDPQDVPLQVLQKTPFGETNSVEHMEISATFSQPMVPLSSNDEMGSLCPIKIIPEIVGRCRWKGTQTLVFEPAKPLLPDHHYHVTIPAGTASKVSGAKLDKNVSWDFNTLRPQINYSLPYNGSKWVALNAAPFVCFTLDVTSAEIKPFIQMTETELDSKEAGIDVPFTLRRPTGEELKKVYRGNADNVVIIQPSSPLRRDHAYHLFFKKGLPSRGGEVGLPADREIQFETWYTFKFKDHSGDIGCLGKGTPSFTLTNPVFGKEFLANLSIDPPVKLNLPEGEWGSPRSPARDVVFYLSQAEYQPATTYTVTLNGNLTDKFGNHLGENQSFSFKIGDFCPRLNMPGGFGVMESDLKHYHPVNGVNIEKARVKVKKIPLEKIIPTMNLLNRSGEYDQEDGEAGWYTPEAKDPIKDYGVDKDWAPHVSHPNKIFHSYVNLNPVLDKDKGGFVLTRILGLNGYWMTAVDDVTPLGLTFKTSPDSTLIWASRLKTAEGEPEVPVEIRGSANQVVWSGVTDKDGFAEAPGWVGLGLKPRDSYEHPSLWLVAKNPQGAAVLSSDMREGIEPWRFNVEETGFGEETRARGFLFTDRGVYRPGETLHLKGIFRTLGVDDWDGMPKRSFKISLRDARGQEVLSRSVTTTSNSSFSASYEIPEGAPTGYWSFNLRDEKNQRIQFSQSVRVEDVKPAAFEVKIHPAQESFLAGDSYRSSVEGWYLFGAPMSGAKGDWHLMLNPTSYQPPDCEGYDFSPGWWENQKYGGYEAASGDLNLDAKGQAAVTAQLDPAKLTGPFAAELEASVTSPDRQRLFGRSSVVVHRANLYVGIKPMGYFTTKGKSWRADIICVTPEGKKIKGVSMRGMLKRRQWMSVQKAGLGGRLEWVSETKDTLVKEFTITSNSGPYPYSCNPEQTGQYFLSFSAKDEKGRPVETAVQFYVGGSGESFWEQRDDDIIELVPDKKSYKPGDIAHILVKSPYQRSKTLVTLERETVLNHWVTETKGGADFIDVPITENCLPNVFVGVIQAQGRAEKPKYGPLGDDLAKPQAKFGYVNLPVDPSGRRLKVEVKTNKEDYRPGQSVTITLRTLNEAGKPTPAEVTLYAVDEGLLLLTGYQTPDVFSAFYGPRGLMVGTVDSRPFVIGQRNFGEKGEERGGGGGGKGLMQGIDLRSKFVPTAYWNASVKTGKKGKTTVTFKLPDNLSRFRVMAVAQAGKRFGSGDSKFKVNKLLLLRPSLPRFSRLRDHFKGGVVVHNNGSKKMEVALELQAETSVLKIDGEVGRTLQVDPGEAKEVLWDISAVQLGEAKLAFRARDVHSKESDGLEWKLPVEEPEHLETVATSAATGDKAEEGLQLPPFTSKENGELKITASSSALCGLKQGAAYLWDYPYGCLEQKLSRSFPVIVGADLMETFGLAKMGSLKKSVQEVMSRLGDYQNPDGGFRYWNPPFFNDPSDPWLTAYALEAAAYALKEKYEVPEGVTTRARQFLNRYLGSQQQWAYPYSASEDYASRAYCLYCLSLWGEQPANYFNELYQKRDQIPFLAKAYLLKASTRLLKDPTVTETLAQELLNQAKISPTTLHFEEPSETRMPWIHGSTVVATAQCLQALLDAKGGFPGDEKAIAWLTQERKTKGRWNNTMDNVRALQAFQDFYRLYEKDTPNFNLKAGLLRDGAYQTVWTDLFQGRSLEAKVKSLPLTEVFSGGPDTHLRLEKEGAGRLYYTLRMSYIPASFDKPVSEGFEVLKTIESTNGAPLDQMKAGDRAVVTLRVITSQDRIFTAINDPLPGGFEIVDPSFATEGTQNISTGEGEGSSLKRHKKSKRISVNQDNDWGSSWGSFNHHENYDDRIQIFADFLSAGEHKYSYLVQATTPGQFTIPSTWAEQMYEPEVFGRTATGGVTIVK